MTTSRRSAARWAREDPSAHQPELLRARDQDAGPIAWPALGRGERGGDAGAVVARAGRCTPEPTAPGERPGDDRETRPRGRRSEPDRQREAGQPPAPSGPLPRGPPPTPPPGGRPWTAPAPWYRGEPRSNAAPAPDRALRSGWRPRAQLRREGPSRARRRRREAGSPRCHRPGAAGPPNPGAPRRSAPGSRTSASAPRPAPNSGSPSGAEGAKANGWRSTR